MSSGSFSQKLRTAIYCFNATNHHSVNIIHLTEQDYEALKAEYEQNTLMPNFKVTGTMLTTFMGILIHITDMPQSTVAYEQSL